MDKDINLCKLLRGYEGIELYTDHFNYGKCILMYIDKKLQQIIVKVPDHGGPFYFGFNKHGVNKEHDGTISHLYPSEKERDWRKFNPSKYSFANLNNRKDSIAESKN